MTQTATKIPQRFIWANELMNIKPNDDILEIGCGAGLLATLIGSRLKNGSLTAIDRSVSMIEKARKRNEQNMPGKAISFVMIDFLKGDLPAAAFDSIVAFNLNFFWKDPVNELLLIRKLLKKKGKLYIFHQAPFEITISAADPIKKKLLENAFEILDIKFQKLLPTSAFCIITKPTDHK